MKQKLLNKFWLRVGMIVAVMTTALAGTAWAQATVGTTLWAETWTGGDASETPSAYGFEGTTIYGGATLTYSQSNSNTKLYAEALAGGTSPELLLSKNNETWTITGIPTGQATEMTLTFNSNKTTFSVTSTTQGISVSGSQKSWTISATSTVSTFNLTIKNTGSQNARIDNVELKVKTIGGSTMETVATPTFDPGEGTFTSAQTVSINCTTSGATIYYTIDGSTPSTSSSVYSSALTISETTTVKAMAVKVGMNNSSVATATYTINLPYTGSDYVRVNSLDDLTDGAKVVIAARYSEDLTTKYHAMTATTTGKPTGVLFTSTTSDNGEILPSDIVNSESTYCWTVGVTSNGYTFTNASDQVLGYSSGTNFATGGNNTEWTISRATAGEGAMVNGYEGFYIINKNKTSRGIALNSSMNYGSYDTGNNNGNGYNFYLDIFVQGATPSVDPAISANNVEIAYNATSGSITYSISNPVSGGVVSAVVTEGDWLTLGDVGETIPFTCAANAETTARTATVTLNYVNNNETLATKTITVTQAAAPVSYTTIPAIFAAATSTETPVYVTFNNWVVSGVSTNGKNVFVTDNSGNGFIIYSSSDMSGTFSAGNILSGTGIACNVQLFNGSAEIINLNTNDLTITAGGTVTAANVALADLAGVNTGALVSYENLTCSVTTTTSGEKTYTNYDLTDGTTTIRAYTTLYDFTTVPDLEDGKTYNITGVYQQYNNTKEILPRSAADIVEVVEPSITVDPATANPAADDVEGTLAITYENLTITDMTDFDVQFCDEDGNGLDAAPDWIEVEVAEAEGGEGYVVSYIMDANTGDARTAYFKVYAMDDDTNLVYSNLVTVTQAAYVAPFTPTTYTLASSITSGKHYIIVGMDEDDDAYAMGEQKSNNRAGIGITISGNTATVSSADVHEVVICGPNASGYYTIYDEGYLYASSSSSNQLKTRTSNSDANSQWVIAINNEGVATITAQGTNSRKEMHFNPNNGTPLFNCYAEDATTGSLPYLYEKDNEATPTETRTLNSEGYATYASQNALDFSDYATANYSAWQITGVDETTGSISFTQITGKVPAGTGMLLKGSGSATLTSASGEVTNTEVANNKLEGIIYQKTITAGQYYGLSGKTFVKVNGGNVPAGRALLPASVVTGTGAKALTFNFDEDATAIKAIDNGQLTTDGVIYNVAGQRLSKMQKGINIVNGKKILK